jgi:hypothetical protein
MQSFVDHLCLHATAAVLTFCCVARRLRLVWSGIGQQSEPLSRHFPILRIQLISGHFQRVLAPLCRRAENFRRAPRPLPKFLRHWRAIARQNAAARRGGRACVATDAVSQVAGRGCPAQACCVLLVHRQQGAVGPPDFSFRQGYHFFSFNHCRPHRAIVERGARSSLLQHYARVGRSPL